MGRIRWRFGWTDRKRRASILRPSCGARSGPRSISARSGAARGGFRGCAASPTRRGASSRRAIPSLWETACNAIVYQQISIHAAGAILRRVIERFARPRDVEGVLLHPFPPVETLLAADDAELRMLGLSSNKVVALKAVGAALAAGDARRGAARGAADTGAAPRSHRAQRDRSVDGGGDRVTRVRPARRLSDERLGRDRAAAHALERRGGRVEPIVEALAPQQGMLYYHLLLGRLAKAGEVTLGPTGR